LALLKILTFNLTDAVTDNPRFKSTDVDEISEAIKDWLKTASNRIKNEEQR
jgi:hypothetical protein